MAGHKFSDDKVSFSLSFIEFLEFSELCLEKLPLYSVEDWRIYSVVEAVA